MNLERQISVRVTEQFYKRFHRKARSFGRPSDLIRELLEAFVENRITLEPNPDKETLT